MLAEDLAGFVDNIAEVRMLQRLRGCDPLLGVVRQQLLQKIPEMLCKLQVFDSVNGRYHVILEWLQSLDVFPTVFFRFFVRVVQFVVDKVLLSRFTIKEKRQTATC